MIDIHPIGKTLVTLGSVLVIVGLLFMVSGKIPWFGRLPGDIVIKRESFTLYVPLATSLLVSLALSAILYLIHRR